MKQIEWLFHAGAVLIHCDTVAFIKYLVFPMRPSSKAVWVLFFLIKEIIFTRVIKRPEVEIPACSGSITNRRQASKTCKALKCENTFFACRLKN